MTSGTAGELRFNVKVDKKTAALLTLLERNRFTYGMSFTTGEDGLIGLQLFIGDPFANTAKA